MLEVYAVEWIKVEFGQRSEGYALFLFKRECIEETKKASARGRYEGGGGYYGPIHPLQYYTIPFDSLEPELQHKLRLNMQTHTTIHWHPKYRSPVTYIR